jgi:protoheme IX farnesyltransferase
VLFAVIFLWTPPHYWPLSIKYRADYADVGVPMLPVVAAPTAVGRQVVAYTWATVAATLALVPVARTGWLYAGSAVVLGAWFLLEAHGLLRRSRAAGSADEVRAMRVFHVSISYLTLLFLALAVDSVLPQRLF